MERKTAIFSGRVQGVGFRATTCDAARDFQVTGFVRNLPNGDVELVAEGDAQELDRFLQAVQGRLSRYIRQCQKRVTPATGEFGTFSIRH